MTHYPEEALILYYYGEGDAPAVKSHLGSCAACAEAFAALGADLGAVSEDPVPARGVRVPRRERAGRLRLRRDLHPLRSKPAEGEAADRREPQPLP